jgi:hypothetical protein
MPRRSKSQPLTAAAVFVFVLLQIGLASSQTDSKGYVGAKVCASCHPTQFAAQSATGHARALSRAGEHALAASFVRKAEQLRPPKYHFRFVPSAGGLKAEVFDERDVLEIPIEWAFGAGEQAVTFVTRIDKDWHLEHYYSYYSLLGSLAPTPGQEALIPKALPDAAGLMYKTLDPKTGVWGCFDCHSTGPLSSSSDGVMQPFELGVRCESCHGPGRKHADAAASSQIDRARKLIENPGRHSAGELNYFCGSCHRPPAGEGVDIDWNFSWNVRHQPVYFSQSDCFKKSNGVLTCLTCHDPHQPLRKDDPAYYNQKCLTCHRAGSNPPREVCSTRQPSDCADCHMPRVAPQPPLRFNNHWIGVYQTGAKLRPSR